MKLTYHNYFIILLSLLTLIGEYEPYSEAHLQPSRTFMMELFCKNSQRFSAVNYFCKKNFIIDIPVGSKCASGSTEVFAYSNFIWILRTCLRIAYLFDKRESETFNFTKL